MEATAATHSLPPNRFTGDSGEEASLPPSPASLHPSSSSSMEPSDVGSPPEEDVEVNCEAAHKIDFDVVDDVQTPITHEKENPVEGFEGKTPDLVLGMKFETEEQAYKFYDEYAQKVGFGIRRDYANKVKDGTMKRRKFCCTRGGHRNEDKQDPVKRRRDPTRMGCMAHIIIQLQSDGTYAIDKFEATHNHQCIPNKANMFKSQRHMRFETEEQAYEFYNEYARKVGFEIRRDYANKIRDGIVKRRKFCCTRGGHRNEDKREANVKRHRDSKRMGCMAHIIIALQPDGTYAIDKFEATHNHQCISNKSNVFSSQRQIIVPQAIESDQADSFAMGPKAAFDFMNIEAEGTENVRFLPIDYDNYLRSNRMRPMAEGDAGDVLQYLREMLVKDPGSLYTVQLDEDDKISNIFWADSNMVIDYHIFGDVVCFDTAYRTNNYGRPFASFFGVNHHKQMVVFGAALIYDETSPSFQWLFKAFLDAMSSKEPTTILTDQDKVMENAISIVMPNTYHRICMWHIYQNAIKHLSSVFNDYESFLVDFSKCIFEYEEEVDFLDAWRKMLEKYNIQENMWLQHLFDEREKWASVYGRNTFCADIKNMQHSETMNSVVKQYLHCSHSLLEFFQQFERLVFDKRKAEAEADFKMTQSTPVSWIDVPILVGARNIYTPEIFKLFQEEYENGMNCTYTIHSTIGTVITHKVYSLKKNRDYIVTFDSLQKTIECCCKKFELSGILCGHALKVLVHTDLVDVPDRYILKRWRKDAKISTVSNSTLAAEDNNRVISTRYGELMLNCMQLSTKAAVTPEAYVLAMEGITNIMEKLEHLQIRPTSTSKSQCIPPHDMGAEPRKESAELHILDVNENIQHTSSVPTQGKSVKRKEKGLKGEKRKKSVLGKVTNRRLSSNAEPPMDTCPPMNLTSSTPLSNHLSQALLSTVPMGQLSGSQHANQLTYPHMLTYQMNPCMNHHDQNHLIISHTSQALPVFGTQPLVTENEGGLQLSMCSKSDGFAPSDRRMGRPPWFP